MQLVMAALVHPVQGESEKCQDVALLKLANCWLQRKSEGHKDSLLLVGIDFPQVEDLRKRVAPLGLRDVDLEVIALDEDSNLEDDVAPVVGKWLEDKHPSAVSFLNWKSLLGDLVVPDLNWWWTGVEAEPAEEYSSILADQALDPRVQHQMVCHHVFAQIAILSQRPQLLLQASNAVGDFDGPCLALQKRAPHAGKAFQVRDDGICQLV